MPGGAEEFESKSANGEIDYTFDYLTVNNDLIVKGDLIVDGDTIIEGGTTITGPIVADDVDMQNLTVEHDALIKGNITIWGSTTETGAVTVTDSINGYLNGEQVHNTNSGNAAASAFEAFNDTNDRAYFGITSSGNTGAHGTKRTFVEGPGLDISTTNGSGKSVRLMTNDTVRATVSDSDITSTVPIVLPGNPTTNLQASTKQYVDAAVTGLGTGTVTSVSSSVPSPFAVNVTNPTTTPDVAITISSSTGSGALVLANTPTLITPNLGGATADTIAVNNLNASLPVFSNGGKALVSGTQTGTGTTLVTNTSPTINNPTLTTPVLGTVTSGDISACTGTATNLTAGHVSVIPTLSGAITSTGSSNVTAFAAAGTSGQILTSNGGSTPPTFQSPAATGTVTSVGMTVPSILNVTPSSITSSGTFAVTTANTPTGSGAIVLANTPTLITPNLGGATADTIAVNNLSNNQVVVTNGSKALVSLSSGTSGQVLISNGSSTAPTFQDITAATTTFIDRNTTGVFNLATSSATAQAGDTYVYANNVYTVTTNVTGGSVVSMTGSIYPPYNLTLSNDLSSVHATTNYENVLTLFRPVTDQANSTTINLYGEGLPQTSGYFSIVYPSTVTFILASTGTAFEGQQYGNNIATFTTSSPIVNGTSLVTSGTGQPTTSGTLTRGIVVYTRYNGTNITAADGDIYSQGAYTYIVRGSVTSSSTIILSSAALATATGTLTRVTGSGSSTITYTSLTYSDQYITFVSPLTFTTSSCNAITGQSYGNNLTSFQVVSDTLAGTSIQATGNGTPTNSGTLSRDIVVYTRYYGTNITADDGAVYHQGIFTYIVHGSVNNATSVVLSSASIPTASGILIKDSGIGNPTITYTSVVSSDATISFSSYTNNDPKTDTQRINYSSYSQNNRVFTRSTGSGSATITATSVNKSAIQLTNVSPMMNFGDLSTGEININLPNALTMSLGQSFLFVASFTFSLNTPTMNLYNYGDTQYLVPIFSVSLVNDGYYRATCLNNSSTAGKWAFTYETSVSEKIAQDILEAAKEVAAGLADALAWAFQEGVNIEVQGNLDLLNADVAALQGQVTTLEEETAGLAGNADVAVVWNGTTLMPAGNSVATAGSLLTQQGVGVIPTWGGAAIIEDGGAGPTLQISNTHALGACDGLLVAGPNLTLGASISAYVGEGLTSGNNLEIYYEHHGNTDVNNLGRLNMGSTSFTVGAAGMLAEATNPSSSALHIENDASGSQIFTTGEYATAATSNVLKEFGRNGSTGNKVTHNFGYTDNNDTDNFYRLALDNGSQFQLNNTGTPSTASRGAHVFTVPSGVTSIVLDNQTVDTSIELQSLMASGLSDTGTASITFGKNNSTNNYATLQYQHDDDGSNNNNVSLSIGNTELDLAANGNIVATGNMEIDNPTAATFTLNAENTGTSIAVSMAKFMAPNISDTGVSTIQIGKNIAHANNYTTLTYQHAGDTSTSNNFTIQQGPTEIELVGTGSINMTGHALINNATNTLTTLIANSTSSSGNINMASFLSPNITSGGTLSTIKFGKNTSTNNLGTIVYQHSSDGSTSNNMSLQIGSAELLLNASGSSQLSGGSLTLPSITLPNGSNLIVLDGSAIEATGSPSNLKLTSNGGLGITIAPTSGIASGPGFSTTGQLVSTVATGTAPLVVSSTTTVANLKAANVATSSTTFPSSSFDPGGVVYGSTATAITSNAHGTSGQSLLSGGTGAPTWGTPALASNVSTSSTTFPSATFTAGGVAYGSTPTTLTSTGAGTSGNSLLSAGSSPPVWGTPALASTVTTSSKTFPSGAFTQKGVIYATGITTIDSTGIAASQGQVLTADATLTPVWANPTTGSVTSVGMTVPSIFNVTPGTITTSGTFAITTANTPTGTGAIVLAAGPTFTGSPALSTATATSVATGPTTGTFTALSTGITTNSKIFPIQLGRDTGNLNCLNVGAVIQASGSGANYGYLGLSGYESLRIFLKNGATPSGIQVEGDFRSNGITISDPTISTSTTTGSVVAKTTYTFTITSAAIKYGDIYSNNGGNFTITTPDQTTTSISASGTSAPAASGTLTKVIGTGPTTLTFSASATSTMGTFAAPGHCNFGNLSPTQTIITSGSGNYTTPANVKYLIVYVTGGGGGGGVPATALGVEAGGGGGGAGGTGVAKFTPTAGQVYAYSVGAGGAGATSANGSGTAGTLSSFSTLGGGAGAGGTPNGKGGNGGVTSNSNRADYYGNGGGPSNTSASGLSVGSGSGGGSYWGGGAAGETNTSVSVNDGIRYGAGGAGGITDASPTKYSNAGSGAGGVIVIDEYYI